MIICSFLPDLRTQTERETAGGNEACHVSSFPLTFSQDDPFESEKATSERCEMIVREPRAKYNAAVHTFHFSCRCGFQPTFCQKVWVFWGWLWMSWSQFIGLYQKKKINPRISYASSYRLTKIWTVEFMFLFQWQRMLAMNPGERGTVTSRRPEGRGSQLFFHTSAVPSEENSRFLICIHATNDKMHQRGCPKPRRLEQPENLLNLCLLSFPFFFFPFW